MGQKGRLSTEEIERIVQEAEQYKQEDAARRAKVDAKNQLENVVYQTKQQIGEKIASVSEYCDEVIVWLDDNGETSRTESNRKSRLTEVKPLGERHSKNRTLISMRSTKCPRSRAQCSSLLNIPVS